MIRSTIKRGLGKILGREEAPKSKAQPYKFDPKLHEAAAAPAPAPAPEPTPPPAAAAPEPVAAAQAEATPVATAAPVAPTDDTVVGPALELQAVQELLDEMVRPALQADGGDISLIKIEGNDIYVKLVGSCSSCPSSIMTMKMGVEALFREEFPSMGQLIQMD